MNQYNIMEMKKRLFNQNKMTRNIKKNSSKTINLSKWMQKNNLKKIWININKNKTIKEYAIFPEYLPI